MNHRITVTITPGMMEGIEALYRQHAKYGEGVSDAYKVSFVLCHSLHLLDELATIRHGGQREGSGRPAKVDKLAPGMEEA